MANLELPRLAHLKNINILSWLEEQVHQAGRPNGAFGVNSPAYLRQLRPDAPVPTQKHSTRFRSRLGSFRSIDGGD